MPRAPKEVSLPMVAREAGCCVKAASLALQHSKGSSVLVSRVQAAAKKLGYIPVVRSTSTKEIILLAPLDYNPGLYIDICEQISQFFHSNRHGNYSIIRINMSNVVLSPLLETEALNHAIGLRPAGIVLIAPTSAGSVDQLHRSRIPAVVVNNRIIHHEIPNVCIDNQRGIEQAVDHLVGLGHVAIAYLHGPKSATSEQERGTAYELAMKKHKLELNQDYMISLSAGQNPRFQAGYNGCEILLGKINRPTAIIAYNDAMAMGAILALKNNDVTIPDDMSIIGCDDLPFGSFTIPRLTTVGINIGDLAERVGDLLLSRLGAVEKAKINDPIVSSLTIRETTDRAPI